MANPNKKHILQVSILLAFFLVIVGYALFGSRDLILGVQIKDVNIEDGKVVDEKVLSVAGNAEHALELTLNGRVVSIDENGNFSETVALMLGYNTLSIKAKDKFGNQDEKFYQLTYVPRESVTENN